jgi:8-oxo-dGTP pyrophosphatase MutT (NUDIX family)
MEKLPPIVAGLPDRLSPSSQPPNDGTEAGMRPAAVLILLFPRDNEVCLLLTRRPRTLRTHAGQISLPGGSWEPNDLDLWHTALRETREELGIDTHGLELLGLLDAVPVAASGYLISPFVAWSPHVPDLSPDPAEVSGIVEVAIQALLDPASIGEEVWELRQRAWLVTFFRLGDVVIWGATARILSLLCRSLHEGFAEREHKPGSVRPL